MALHRKVSRSVTRKEVKQAEQRSVIDPIFARAGEAAGAPTHVLPVDGMRPETAYQVVHDELMLDGNARLNLATFVTTWMEPQAEQLMSETFDKNMIDKDEYPRTADLEMRCVSMLARLWNSPDEEEATGTSTTGSSEAAMLGGMALKWRWRERMRAAGKPTDKPNMVMGINVQVCWEKFCRYWDVEMRLVPMEGNRFHLSADEAVKRCDENTIGVVAILGSTFDGSYEPIEDICKALDQLQADTGLDIPVHVDGASGAFIAPFIDPSVVWDFRLPPRAVDQRVRAQVRARLSRCGLGGVAQPGGVARRPRVQGQLPGRGDADVLVELLPTRQPDRRAVLQLHPVGQRRIPRACSRRRATSPAPARRRLPRSAPSI